MPQARFGGGDKLGIIEEADITKVYSIVDWDLLRFFRKSGFIPSRIDRV